MKNELQSLRLFSPLFPHIYRKNEWGDLDDYREDLSAGEVLEYEDKILALIQKEKLPSEGELWGVTEVQTHSMLSTSELAELTEWLYSQFSDGWGEGLEQREIKVEDGELYLSFWDSSDRFFIKPEDELKGSQSFGLGMTMGGMR